MIGQSALMTAIENAAINPKVATTVSATTTIMGLSAALDQIQSGIGIISLVIGCIVGIFVVRVHSMKYKLLKRAWDNGETPTDLS